MHIRAVTTEDIPAILDLLRRVGALHHDIRPDLFRDGACKYDENELRRLLKDDKYKLLCCEIKGRVKGYVICILQAVRDDPVLCDDLSLYIDDLCVDETERGTSCAMALYEAASDYARSIGCDHITLNVWTGNDRALRFYEKCGFLPRKVTMERTL